MQAFVAFIGQYAADLDERFSNQYLVEDKSLFKAKGPVWHQSDRKLGRIPKKLRNLDLEGSWSKSGYHGWVYGYGLYLSCMCFSKAVSSRNRIGSRDGGH